MKKQVLSLILFVLVGVLLFYPGCNNGNGGAQYILTVTLGGGVNGTPATGTHTYSADTAVNYSYSLQSGYKNLQVILDGATTAPTGVVMIGTSNHTLNATASPWDVRGNWQGLHTDDNNSDPFHATFSGSSAASGNCSGDIGGPTGTGTFTYSGPNISFYLDFGFARFDCTGTLSDENHMSGTWSNAAGFTGTWQLTRI